MNAPPDPPPPNGKAMIAAYRAARLSQRPVLRTALHESHVARRTARCATLGIAEPAAPRPADPPPAAARPADRPAMPDAADAPSVFAGLVSSATAPRPAEPEPQPEPPEAPPPAPYDPPLAEVGFGPGMLIRLSQLGLRTAHDLAQADAGQLRAELGDISRLVDVEAWIASARQAAGGLHP